MLRKENPNSSHDLTYSWTDFLSSPLPSSPIFFLSLSHFVSLVSFDSFEFKPKTKTQAGYPHPVKSIYSFTYIFYPATLAIICYSDYLRHVFFLQPATIRTKVFVSAAFLFLSRRSAMISSKWVFPPRVTKYAFNHRRTWSTYVTEGQKMHNELFVIQVLRVQRRWRIAAKIMEF